MAILGILDDHQVHGYELNKQMAELSGGQGGVSFGSLYPALNRLERSGFVRVAAKPTVGEAAAVQGPMTGAITGELAALRQRRLSALKEAPSRRGDKRNRKVYAITESGRERLRELIRTVDPADDRAFGLQVAFCRRVPAGERLAIFERRRSHLLAMLAGHSSRDSIDETDPYQRSLRDHDTATLTSSLAWVDELAAITRQQLGDHSPQESSPPPEGADTHR